MNGVLLVCAFVAYTTAVAGQELGVSDAMAARVDAQAWRADRLTKQYQAISDKADSVRAAAKAGGDLAKHLLSVHFGKSRQFVIVLPLSWGMSR